MGKNAIIVLTVLLISAFLTQPARAEPKMITLGKLLKQLTAVTVGKCLGHERLPNGRLGLRYRLQVDKVLYGDPRLVGRRLVPASGQMHVPDNTPCVTFFDKSRSLQWVAVPVRGKSLKNVPLKISGLYSYNAYFVVPHLLTLGTLKQLIATRKAHYRARGALHFLEPGSGRVKASSIVIDVDYHWPSGRYRVRGLPSLVGFPKPRVGLGVGLLNDVYLRYRAGYPRPLSIGGTVYGIQGQTMLVKFYVVAPSILRLADFLRYVRQPALHQRHFELSVRLQSGKRWRIEIGKSDYSNDRLWTDPKTRWTIRTDLDRGLLKAKRGNDSMTIRFRPPRALVFPGAGRLGRLVRDMMAGSLPCTATVQRGLGMSRQGCSLSIKAFKLTPYPAK